MSELNILNRICNLEYNKDYQSLDKQRRIGILNIVITGNDVLGVLKCQ